MIKVITLSHVHMIFIPLSPTNQIHAEVLVTYPALVEKIGVLRVLQQQMWHRLEDLFHNNLCLVQFLSNIQV